MLSAVTLPEFTLMFRENLIKVTIHLIKHTPFINFGGIFSFQSTGFLNIKSVFLVMNGYIVSLFQF